MKKLNVSDFSPRPFGRYRTDGKSSGEAFRDDLLIPALRTNDYVIIDLHDACSSMGSSFLHEVFAFLITKFNFTREDLALKIEIYAPFDDIEEEIWAYILMENDKF